MTILLYIAALITFAVGIAHSILGERYLLTPLFRRRDLPWLFGSQDFTTRTLRFAWHITTIAWWGFAAILFLLARRSLAPRNVALILAAAYLSSGLLTLLVSRGKHLAWLAFLFVGVVCLLAALA